jgi:uncharacterized damage-inducible protein DinB
MYNTIVMANNLLAAQFLKELEAEAAASRKCLERVPENLFKWKPHERSMEMGYLAIIVMEIPRWVSTAVEAGEINFGTFKHATPKDGAELVAEFDKNMEEARRVLGKASDEDLAGMFYLKAGDKVLMSGTKLETVSSSINHGVHHRGQLTVYMRLNNIPVPSIYGPSADDKTF